jgi:hypothetical protein
MARSMMTKAEKLEAAKKRDEINTLVAVGKNPEAVKAHYEGVNIGAPETIARKLVGKSLATCTREELTSALLAYLAAPPKASSAPALVIPGGVEPYVRRAFAASNWAPLNSAALAGRVFLALNRAGVVGDDGLPSVEGAIESWRKGEGATLIASEKRLGLSWKGSKEAPSEDKPKKTKAA